MEWSYEKYLEEHHQVMEMFLRLATLAIKTKNVPALQYAINDAEKRIAEAKLGHETEVARRLRGWEIRSGGKKR